MRISGSVLLARSKLKVRRLRTAVTIMVSGLLFGVTITLMVVLQSSMLSTEKINDSLFGGKYYVYATRFNSDAPLLEDASVRYDAETIYQQTINAKKTAADHLGIAFDTQSEIKPTTYDIVGDTKTPILDATSPSAQKAIANYRKIHPSIGRADLEHAAAAYHPSNIFQVKELHSESGSLAVMSGGKESFETPAKPSDDFLTHTFPRVVDESVTKPFMTGSSSTDDKEIPVLVPFSMAERLLDLKKLTATASSEQKVDRMNQLKAMATNHIFSVCYRNDISKNQIDNAIAALSSSTSDSGDGVTYALPNASDCASATVAKDTRSPAQKATDSKQAKFNSEFGLVTTPVQQKVLFKVVGILPDDNVSSAGNNFLTDVLRSIFGTSQLGTPMIPLQIYQKTQAAKIYGQALTVSTDITSGMNQTGYLLEFTNKASMRQFINEHSCSEQQFTCQDSNKPFYLSEFGTTSARLIDFQTTIDKITSPVLIGIAIVSAIIMAGTFGRIVADSRREIAVFRAVGAPKTSIVFVFMTYSLMLSILVAIFAYIIGMLGALVTDLIFGQQATTIAYATYGFVNSTLRVHFFMLNVPFVWWVVGATILTGIVSMLLTLQGTMGRTIINDIRDE